MTALALVIILGAWNHAHRQSSARPASADAAISSFPSGARSSPSPTPERVRPVRRAHIGRNVQTVHGVPFSFRVTTPGWERFGGVSIDKSTEGSKGAGAIIYWAAFPHDIYADPCPRALRQPVGRSAADLASAVSAAPGTELLEGPSDVSVGGYDAKRVALAVRRNIGCAPGFFYSWNGMDAGALRPVTRVGDTMSVWIVRVHGTRFFIEAETSQRAGAGLEHEVRLIVDSIRFDWSNPHHRWPW